MYIIISVLSNNDDKLQRHYTQVNNNVLLFLFFVIKNVWTDLNCIMYMKLLK